MKRAQYIDVQTLRGWYIAQITMGQDKRFAAISNIEEGAESLQA